MAVERRDRDLAEVTAVATSAETPLAGVADDSVHVEPKPTPRAEFIGAVMWIGLGVAIAIGSWRMDRLTEQGVNPYTVPGLVPGLLGVAMVLFGSLMLVRSARAGGARGGTVALAPFATYARLLLIVALCVGFAVGLVGHGLPFWAAAALYVTIAIFALQYPELKANGTVVRGLVKAVTIGICAGVVVTLVFEQFFLVRLP